MLAGIVVAGDPVEALKKIEKNPMELYEIRVDAMHTLENFELLEKHKNRLILTVRRIEEGGFRKLSERKRKEIFERILEISPRYVDIEHRSSIKEEVMRVAKKRDAEIILSYHNFQETPSFDILRRIVDKMKEGDVKKIVTMARDFEDNVKLLRIYEVDKNAVAFCMGSRGKLSRLCSYFLAPFTYVPLGDSIAPGQISLQEFLMALRVVEK